MKNRFPGRCNNCKKSVLPNQGTIIKSQGKWLVTCDKCEASKNSFDSFGKDAIVDERKHKFGGW